MANVVDHAALFTAFTTLFVVIDLIGLSPILSKSTKGMAPQKRKATPLRACIISFIILVLFDVLGYSGLGFAGISMSAFQISGRALLFLTVLEMLFALRNKRHHEKGAYNGNDDCDQSVFPPGIPLITGRARSHQSFY